MALPLLIDPRLLVRALDDLRAIADAARSLPGIEERLTQRLEDATAAARSLEASAEAQVDRLMEGLDRIEGRADELLGVLRRIDDVDAHVRELTRIAGDTLPQLQEGLGSVDELSRAAKALTDAAAPLAGAAEPLQGAAERLGRIAERLPGGRRPS